MDRRLFQYKTHPARRLLNSLSEAVEGNKGEGPQERELLQKAEHTVDRLLAEFNEDIAIFETLEQELRSFLEQHRRRIELAERRATEAQRGQERLEQARTLAGSELSTRVENVIVPDALNDFLTRIWSHHLSMIALREGPESVSWNTALNVADGLIGLLPRDGHAPPPVAPTIAGIRDPLEAVLASSGITGESAGETIRILASSLEIAQKIAPIKPPVARPEPVAEPATVAATDGPAQANTTPFLSVASDKDRLDYNDEDIALLRGLKIGAWIDLAGEDEKLHPAKLSWVSPISSRLMFVNRRGVRVLVASIEELAAMKKVRPAWSSASRTRSSTRPCIASWVACRAARSAEHSHPGRRPGTRRLPRHPVASPQDVGETVRMPVTIAFVRETAPGERRVGADARKPARSCWP